ncbi:HTH-type transcriptional repressor ComR [mine drainage metagenome]|uniref:HTH-type transcriptional repressor ComR n=1 Tax=mine drainage metagenome TaxID=410659 RepID=A0A1J5R927_9ZZZZ
MGRNQTFETTTVVAAARDVFWGQGYEATSVADLEEATGVNRSSLYHAFGSKRGLFDAAVQDYLDTVIRPRLRVLTGSTAGRLGLLAYVDGLRSAVQALPDDSPRRGCLLVNCAAGLAGHDDAARAVVDDYRVELTAALGHSLAVAGVPDEIDEGAIILSSLTISAMLLARINREAADLVLGTARRHVLEWTADNR